MSVRWRKDSQDAVTRVQRVQEKQASTDSEPQEECERPLDRPCHKSGESLLSSTSGFVNYRGLLNDCILLLVLSNTKNVITNLLKYGILVDPLKWPSALVQPGHFPAAVLVLVSWALPLLIFLVEKVASKGKMSDRNVAISHCTCLLLMLAFPVSIIFPFEAGPFGSFLALSTYTIYWLKMVSYVQVNWWCRTGQRKLQERNAECSNGKEKVKLVQYPENLYLRDFAYFMFAPTLCYELNFPRTKRIRKIFLLRRFLEALFLLNVLMALFQQWLVPTVLNSMAPFQKMDFALMIERILLLAIPNHLIWLLFFYWFFHSVLNMLAELMRFGDRCFYKDWWNATNILRFWNTWNVPVHRWALRHVYRPIVGMGYSKMSAMATVFLLSAFFHEYLVSIPLQLLKAWAFTAMIVQVPLAILTSMPMMEGQFGNVVVWVSIVLGQPLAILMYMHDYYLMHYGPLNETLTAT